MANSDDPDQTAPLGAVWSGSGLFACVILSGALVFEILGHLRVNVLKFKHFIPYLSGLNFDFYANVA